MATDPKIVVETQMLIRRPVQVVFEAFIDPEITKNFWFTQGSDKLEVGKTLTWEWGNVRGIHPGVCERDHS
ncbi:MAG: hypothetical protein WD426_18520 [Anditalea sp.]